MSGLKKSWVTNGIEHIKVLATDKGANDELKKAGAILEATYFTNTGIKKYNQYSLKKKDK